MLPNPMLPTPRPIHTGLVLVGLPTIGDEAGGYSPGYEAGYRPDMPPVERLE